MKTFFKVIIVFIFDILSACNSSQENSTFYIENFENQVLVNAKPASWITSKAPMQMLQIDSFLIILNKEGESVFEIYNTNTQSLIKSVGKFGRGPNEFMMLNLITRTKIINKEHLFYAYSTPKKKVYTLNLEKMFQGENFIEKEDDLSKRYSIQTHIIKLDNCIIGISNETKGKIFKFYLSNKQIDLWDYYPGFSSIDKLDDYQRYLIYARLWAYNKNKNILAGAYSMYFNKLVFFNVNGKVIKTINLPISDYVLNISNFPQDVPFYATNIVNSNEKIYISYYNYGNLKNANNGIINVFNWSGVPIKQYVIKSYKVISFTVDEKNSKIYAKIANAKDYSFIEINI